MKPKFKKCAAARASVPEMDHTPFFSNWASNYPKALQSVLAVIRGPSRGHGAREEELMALCWTGVRQVLPG